MPRPRKFIDGGSVISAYVPHELYEKVKALADSKGKSISEVACELIRRGLESVESGVATAADPPDPPGDALHVALKGLEPLERERVLQFMKELDDAEAKLAKLGPSMRQVKTGRPTLLDVVSQQEVMKLRGTVNDLKRTYEKKIKRVVRNPTTLNIIGERLLRLMKELGVPA
jgi:hypothetical protein